LSPISYAIQLSVLQHGALGFLAGTTMEKEATPNVGLWDQRAVLEWIQKYIHLVNGDADDVTVWGQVCFIESYRDTFD
jgi:carboxylesterase type B